MHRAHEAAHNRNYKRPLAALAAVGICAGYLLIGNNAAAAGIVPVAPHALQTNTSVAANKSVTPVVSGGATTVPTDATRVQFAITVTKPTATGTLIAYPTDNAAAASGSVAFTAGGTGTGTLTESVGLSNKVTFVNQSSGTILLTVKITGYSTEVRASDVSGTGGTSGQVLTNTGAGASWQAPGHAYEQSVGVSQFTLNESSFTTVSSLTVPAGSYLVTWVATAFTNANSPDFFGCYLRAPSGNQLQGINGSSGSADPQSTVSAQGLLTTTGGAITVICIGGSSGTLRISTPILIATAEGTVSGYVTH